MNSTDSDFIQEDELAKKAPSISNEVEDFVTKQELNSREHINEDTQFLENQSEAKG